MKVLKEFKEFAVKGNMFDMAVGIIIGTAFSKVVTSLVNNIIMPPLIYITGKMNFSSYQIILQPKKVLENGEVTEAVAIEYGSFLQIILDFIIVGFTIFLVIRFFNRLRTKAEDVKNTKESTPKNIELLAEIRDLLKQQA
ncbi:large-conductance mechanosensitive channel protein MscL [Psychroflexus sp. ALD_RP9]|uniref:large-conductance mechanosensitive channel protein MscL n=1 Tax=Psychroflexus sp. ALD_RP9 TaxID=2777186 RepID=UPI001A8E5B11|nr:large-conductance mechanosensitive channel protein MscL [Psychroflexus sp. ALD_RP9]QSS97462.1 large-conductance mechanosensitive channel protein MscL [Psychroflexus sp. ALD_RP9]